MYVEVNHFELSFGNTLARYLGRAGGLQQVINIASLKFIVLLLWRNVSLCI